jgi:hypothetical protein
MTPIAPNSPTMTEYGDLPPSHDFCKSRRLHNNPAAGAPLPRIFLAPLFRFGPKRWRAASNISSTKPRLPITAPAVKYLTRHRNIRANASSPIRFSAASIKRCFSAASSSLVRPLRFVILFIPPLGSTRSSTFSPAPANNIFRYSKATSPFHKSASAPRPLCARSALTKPARAFFPLPFAPPPIASP